jgi:ABC-type transport system involved in cytochrome c biogenesis permease subunit
MLSLLLSVGLVLASYGATQGPQRGWTSRAVWPYCGSGVLLLVTRTTPARVTALVLSGRDVAVAP